jgi:hypothetical protein
MNNSRFFIKKVWFQGEDDTICELISINKEVKEHTSIFNVEVIASLFREFQHQTEEYLDIKKYITQVEAELLSELVSNQAEFLERVNNIIE